MSNGRQWERFKQHLCVCESVGVTVDISRMNFSDGFFSEKDADARKALEAMDQLEAGAIANPDEKRMVGHYWLRDSSRAPSPEIRKEIESCLASIRKFAKAVHDGKIKPQKAKKFTNVLTIGIGGSALGPEFVAKALGTTKDKMKPYFFDNTDPDGMDYVLDQIGSGLKETLCVNISKSGGTIETRNGMLESRKAYEAAGLNYGLHAVAVTGEDSLLDQYAVKNKFIERFPMWDWVGGRTSEMSAVGLLPAALQGVDILAILRGAKAMDEVTRTKDIRKNPAMLMALMWYHAGGGRGTRDMVILPYKDRFELFSRYLQQLVMESLGKELDLNGRTVHQGIAVYGNKGSTDQHAYVQQLRDGINNFFVTFVEVLKDRQSRSMAVEPGVTSGDYLSGFFQGTRRALHDSGRESITVTVPDTSADTVGKLIALYDRAVGFYGSLVNINAYHQPGVEAGKQAAAGVLEIQKKIVGHLKANKGSSFTVEQLAQAAGLSEEVETVFKVLQHATANPEQGIKKTVRPGGSIFDATYVVGK